MAFERFLEETSINELQKAPLFKKYLRKDCLNGSVFPAIRRNRVDFYYKGGKLFSWEAGDRKGFRTHHKYASVLCGQQGDYIKEGDLLEDRLRRITDFC